MFRKALLLIGVSLVAIVLAPSTAEAAVVDTDHLTINDPDGRWNIAEHWFGAQAAVTWKRETGFDQVIIQARLNKAPFNVPWGSCAEVRVRSTRTDGTRSTTRYRTCYAEDLTITDTARGRRLSKVRVQLFEIHIDCIYNDLTLEDCDGGLGGGYGGVLNRLIGSVTRFLGD
jgi:hypothetical protein